MKRRLSLRARCSLGLGALGLASILGIPALAAPPANDDRGLESAPAINYSGLDQVNLFNGGLSISIPLGPRFPLGPGTDYGFSLQYSSQLWDGQSVDDQGSHNPWQVNPSKTFNAGLGWRVSLGMLLPPNDIASGWWNWTFISPDGSQHRFSDRLHPADPLEAGTLYATDGSYLRFSVAGKRVDTPSGLSYFFQATAPTGSRRSRTPSATGSP